ncbi:MAG: HEAT repeat domain-containing protein [Myxococcales bacterium]|nr:HEAT repeat domain-containing protein [Myxococcales bacterium]
MDSIQKLKALMASDQPDELRRGLALLREEIPRAGTAQARPLFDLLTSLFYVDPLDRPDLVPVVDEALGVLAGFGPWVIPLLVERLDAGDLKAQMAVAHALGRMGAAAVEPLVEAYRTAPDDDRRAFALYALGMIQSPAAGVAAPLALEAARSSDLELRDTATRAIGRLAEHVPPGAFGEAVRAGLFEQLCTNAVDENAGVRAKAVRSLAALARRGHLGDEERATVRALCRRILGREERFEWDLAYVVRREAEAALGLLT